MEVYRRGHNDPARRLRFAVRQQSGITAIAVPDFVIKLNIYYLEVYRRGHNGPDSKSGIRQRIVGSNPTASARKKWSAYRVPTRDFFGKAVLFKSQAWRDATPFLVLFNFLHLINHQNRVNLLLQLNCR